MRNDLNAARGIFVGIGLVFWAVVAIVWAVAR